MTQLISVVIPTYNRDRTIERTIESVLKQTYKNYEIIIVDDNSNDNTESIIKKYLEKYSFITYIKHDFNKGGAEARNTGVENSTGEIISFLDSDDEWLEEKLEKDIETINKENADMVYCDMISIDVETGNQSIGNRESYDDIYYQLLKRNVVGGTSIITVKKSVFQAVGGFKKELPSCQDWEFYLNIAKGYKIVKINKPLIKYYIHANSISGNINNAIEGHKYMLEKVKLLIDNDRRYYNKRNEIISEHYITIAMIYRRFRKFDDIKKNYIKAWMNNKFNIVAIKNIALGLCGENIYYKLIKNK